MSTIVVVTHELASIFAIGNNSIYLDLETKSIIASGNPKKMLEESQNPIVRAFLTRGAEKGKGQKVEGSQSESRSHRVTKSQN